MCEAVFRHASTKRSLNITANWVFASTTRAAAVSVRSRMVLTNIAAWPRRRQMGNGLWFCWPGAARSSAPRCRSLCRYFAHAFGVRVERFVSSQAAPALRDRWILLAPRSLCEGIEGGLADLGIGRAIDGPKRLRDVLAILPGGKIHGMADQVNDAGLNDRLRETALMASVKPFRPSTTAISMSWRRGSLVRSSRAARTSHPRSARPNAEDLLSAIRQDAKRDVDRLVAHVALVADLDPNARKTPVGSRYRAASSAIPQPRPAPHR